MLNTRPPAAERADRMRRHHRKEVLPCVVEAWFQKRHPWFGRELPPVEELVQRRGTCWNWCRTHARRSLEHTMNAGVMTRRLRADMAVFRGKKDRTMFAFPWRITVPPHACTRGQREARAAVIPPEKHALLAQPVRQNAINRLGFSPVLTTSGKACMTNRGFPSAHVSGRGFLHNG